MHVPKLSGGMAQAQEVPVRVALIFGGRSVEHHVSVRSARTVLAALSSAGHDVLCLGINEAGVWHDPAVSRAVLEADLKDHPALPPGGGIAGSVRHLLDAHVDVVFPIVHGTFGEDGALQGLCEMIDVPYVGCGVSASAVAMDKVLSKRLFQAAGLPVVPFAAINRQQFDSAASDEERLACLRGFADGPYPLFVKPSVGGSSVGCKLVKTRTELLSSIAFALRFDEVALVERGVKAREVEVAVLGAQASSMEASLIGEIIPGSEFYDYEDKYLKDDARLLAPAPVTEALASRLRETAIHAMAAIGGYGLARVDFFLMDDGSFFLNEINTLPGFTSVSMYPRLWELSGVPLPHLVSRLVELAQQRHGRAQRTQQSLRDFVASVAPT